MPRPPLQPHSLKLTQVQRRAVAEVQPKLAERLRVELTKPLVLRLTDPELAVCNTALDKAVRAAEPGTRQAALRAALNIGTAAHTLAETRRKLPGYTVKITLLGTRPSVWRQIVIDDCRLDTLHLHIQNAMGWEKLPPV